MDTPFVDTPFGPARLNLSLRQAREFGMVDYAVDVFFSFFSGFFPQGFACLP